MEDQGLRERKKAATRRRISDVATRLFALRGFEAVTIADVAEAAEVSKQTVTNYFPRKEDLFLDRHLDRMAELRQVILGRAAGESVLAALRRYHHALLEARHPLSGAIENVAPFFAILRASPALLNRLHEQGRELEEALGEVLSREVGEGPRTALAASLIASAMNAIFNTAVRRILDGDDVQKVRRDQVRVIDLAFDLLEHGIGPYGAAAEGAPKQTRAALPRARGGRPRRK